MLFLLNSKSLWWLVKPYLWNTENVRDGKQKSANKTSAIQSLYYSYIWFFFSENHLHLYSSITAIHFYSYH